MLFIENMGTQWLKNPQTRTNQNIKTTKRKLFNNGMKELNHGSDYNGRCQLVKERLLDLKKKLPLNFPACTDPRLHTKIPHKDSLGFVDCLVFCLFFFPQH